LRTWKRRLRILEDDINRDNSVRSLHQIARLYIEGEQIVLLAIPKVAYPVLTEAEPEGGELRTDHLFGRLMPLNEGLPRYDSRSTNLADQPQHLPLQSKILFCELNSAQVFGGKCKSSAAPPPTE
jgi:hypothetical protein